MNLKDLTGSIPDVLLLVIPGYVSLKIKEKFGIEKKKDNLETALYSVLYSFIIGIAYSIINTIFAHKCPQALTFFENESVRQIVCLMMACILGWILVKFPKSAIGSGIEKLYDKSISPDSVWIEAMENKEGTWVNVYLNNGVIYTGALINYTADANSDEKEILLSNYRLAVRNTGKLKDRGEFCTVIDDYTDKPDARVYLSQKVIVCIELCPKIISEGNDGSA